MTPALGLISLPAPPSNVTTAVADAQLQLTGAGGPAFSFTLTDTKGWQDFGVVNVLVNDALDGRHACYLAYSRPLNTVYLVNDAGDGLLPGVTLGARGVWQIASVRSLRWDRSG